MAQSNKVALAILAGALVAMIVDVSLARVYDLVTKQPTSHTRIAIYVLLTSICIGSQIFVIEYAAIKSAKIRTIAKMRIRPIHTAVRISQFVIAAILVFMMLQVILYQYYYTILVITVVWISHAIGIVLLALLAKRFLAWFTSDRNHVIATYAVSSLIIAVNLAFTAIYVNDVLMDRTMETGPYSAGSMVLIPRNSMTAIYNSAFFVSSILAFSALWVSTTLLLRHKAQNIGRLRFWLTLSSPLVLFLAQFVSYFGHVLDPFLGSDPVVLSLWVTLIFTVSKPIGGILFGIAFYTLARKFGNNIELRNYLIISSLGFVLLFAANQASVLLVAPFPAFGIASVSFTGIASYFVLLGIYSAAISISQDTRLRQIVRRKTEDESGMLGTIGTAQVKEEIARKVIRVVKDNSDRITAETGIERSESQEIVKEYIDDVIAELRASKSTKLIRDSDADGDSKK